jgi:hypothetical protein
MFNPVEGYMMARKTETQTQGFHCKKAAFYNQKTGDRLKIQLQTC